MPRSLQSTEPRLKLLQSDPRGNISNCYILQPLAVFRMDGIHGQQNFESHTLQFWNSLSPVKWRSLCLAYKAVVRTKWDNSIKSFVLCFACYVVISYSSQPTPSVNSSHWPPCLSSNTSHRYLSALEHWQKLISLFGILFFQMPTWSDLLSPSSLY